MLHTIARLACAKTRVVHGPIEQGSDIKNRHQEIGMMDRLCELFGMHRKVVENKDTQTRFTLGVET